MCFGRNDGAWAHPFLFFLIGLLAAVEIGLTAYQVHKHKDAWPSEEFKNRLIFLLFTACWTFLGALMHWIINLFIGLFWTTLSFIFWTIAAALFRKVQPYDASDCSGTDINSRCRQYVAIEAISWTEVALTAILFLAILFHWGSASRRPGNSYRNTGYNGFYA
ncbi:hypothetical protein T439DRAFT_326911 [Meredithblackwellia eburnea MCA 4105]